MSILAYVLWWYTHLGVNPISWALNWTGPLVCGFLSDKYNTVLYIYFLLSIIFLLCSFSSLLYCRTVVYNIYNLKNLCSLTVCYRWGFLSPVGYSWLSSGEIKSRTWVFSCVWGQHLYSPCCSGGTHAHKLPFNSKCSRDTSAVSFLLSFMLFHRWGNLILGLQ